MKVSFDQILRRISTIDRDIQELNRFKNRIPGNRVYYSNLNATFDGKLKELKHEKDSLLELTIKNPPNWILGVINSFAIESRSENKSYTPKGLGNLPKLEKTMNSSRNVKQFLRDIPKTEIHLHLEACLSKSSLLELLNKNEIKISEEEFNQKFIFNDLNGFIQLFFFIQSSVKHESDFSILIDSVGQYMKRDNIIYSEVYLAPTKFLQIGLDFNKMMEVVIRGIRKIKSEDEREIKLLVDVSRTFGSDNAMNNLKRVLKLEYPEVIGIGLGGAELLGPAKDYEEVFALAKQSGLRVVAHAGEDDGPWSIWDAIKYLKAERIGHGTSAIQDPELMKYLKDNKIPLEVCITSNLFTGKYVKLAENHPVKQFYENGIIITINTDDPEIFDVRLSDEFLILHENLKFNIDEIMDIIKSGVYATFHPEKDELWSKIKSEIDKFRIIYDL